MKRTTRTSSITSGMERSTRTSSITSGMERSTRTSSITSAMERSTGTSFIYIVLSFIFCYVNFVSAAFVFLQRR